MASGSHRGLPGDAAGDWTTQPPADSQADEGMIRPHGCQARHGQDGIARQVSDHGRRVAGYLCGSAAPAGATWSSSAPWWPPSFAVARIAATRSPRCGPAIAGEQRHPPIGPRITSGDSGSVP